MELSTLKFSVDTSELDRAAVIISGLATNVSKLDKASRDAAQTETILAKAAKANADANLQNAKAQDVRLKTTITADKADKANEESIAKKTKAVESHTQATKENVGILQRQTDIYDFLAQGFSKGQAGILASAKATGQYSKELEQVLEMQKQFTSDPFDRSDTGLKRLQRTIKEVTDAQSYFNAGHNLTSKQARELSNDLDRLNAGLTQQGKSYQDITKAQSVYKQQFLDEAAAVNKANSALAMVEKQRKDVVSATNYVTQADQKMAAALNQSNASLDKGATDSLVKYETALRKSGVSQDVATQRLAKYKVQLEQVQKAEAAHREQFLTRALAPQATDVVVSLWSGQNPLTVLLQQGGQVNDLFMQSGIAAERFGEVVKKSMASMLPSIITVAKGVGGLIVDGFVAAGNAVVNFVGKVTGMNTVLEMGNKKLQALGFGRVAEGLKDIGGLLTGVAAVGVAALITALVSLGIAFKNALKEGAELSRNLELTGASLALTKSAAIDLAQSLATSERPVASVVSVINELAKAGKFSSENIALVTNAAIDLERYGKVAIADTAKELSKLREDPVKALIEVAEKTGYVNVETIETVKSLREQGKMAEAAELAMKAWATSSTSAATSIKNQMSPLEQVWDSMLNKINQVIGRLQDLARGSGLAEQIADKEAQLASVKGGFFTSTFGLSPKGAKDVDRLSEEIYMLKLQLQAETDITKERAKRSSAAAQLKAETEATKEYTAAIEKQAGKEATLSEFVKKALEERTRSVAAALSKNVGDVKLSADAIDKITKGAELQWKGMQKKPKKDSSENYYATIMREATDAAVKAENANEGFTKSQIRMMEVTQDPRFLKLAVPEQEAYLAKMANNSANEKIASGQDLINRLIGKGEGVGKEYYAQMKELESLKGNAGIDQVALEKAMQALRDTTPAAKKAAEEIKNATKAYNEYAAAAKSVSDTADKENLALDNRLMLLGKTTDEQKYLKIEQEETLKLLELEAAKQKEILKIKNDTRLQADPMLMAKNLQDIEEAYAKKREVINKEVAVKFAEDFNAEMQKIETGISDSIVTALFEGGKAGSAKLRSVIIEALKKPVTIVVNAVVNALLNSVLGSLMGDSSGSTSTGSGSTLSSLGGLNGSITSAIGKGFTTFASSSVGQSLGLSSTVADEGAGHIALTSTGRTIGAGLGMLGNGVAGYGISSAISGGYSLGGGNTVNVIAGIASAFFGPIAGVIGGLINRAFGKKLADTGVQGTFGGTSGFQGENYQYYKGGWFASDSTKTSEMDPALKKMLSDSFKAMQAQVGTFATVLGLSTDKIAGFTTTMKVSLMGLSQEDATKKIQEALATANNELAQQVIGTWTTTTEEVTSQVQNTAAEMEAGGNAFSEVTKSVTKSTYVASEYAKEGEKAIDTLTRLATSLTTVNQVFDTLGYALLETGLKAADTASKLIDAFGGADAFVSSTSSFYQNFYSDTERQSTALRQLNDEFKKHNITLPKTKDEYRKLVEAQDLNTEAGRNTYAWLVKLAPTYATAADDISKTVQDQLDAQKQAAKDALNIQIKSAQDQVNIFQKLYDFLDTELKKLYGTVTSTARIELSKAKAVVSNTLATGVFPEQSAFEDAVNTITGSFSNSNYTSKIDADRDRLRFAAQLDDLKTIAGKSLNSAKTTLDYLNLQLETLDKQTLIYNKQLDSLNQIVGGVQDVVEAVNGIGKKPSSTGTPTPTGSGTGGEGPGITANPYTTRTSYGAEEAVTSFDKFKAWYMGLKTTAELSKDYQAPDWLKVAGLAGSDGSDSELFKAYMFYKNNPQYAKDYEKTMTGGTSDYSTSGNTVSKSDINAMPKDAQDYYKANPAALRSAEGFGFDPVLAYRLQRDGAESLGIDPKTTDVQEWLRRHKYTDSGVVTNDNTSMFANMPYRGYNLPKYDTTTGTIIDFDGTIYTPDGRAVGHASKDQMTATYGANWVANSGIDFGTERRSVLYQNEIGSGKTPEQYYAEIKANVDKAIAEGKSAQSLVDVMNQVGVSVEDVAKAYGITPDEVRTNLKNGGATNIPAFASGGNYPGGLALVGERGPELINFSQGGYVHNASQTSAMLSSNSVVESLTTLNSRIEMVEAAVRSTAVSNNKIAKLLDRVIPAGDAISTRVVV